MSFLSMMEARLPPGFRFHPRDEELVCDYLARKVAGDGNYGSPMLIAVDLNKCEPWDLPEMACVGGKEWYFFSLRDRKYATGQRTNRATVSGYWKATGKDRPVARKGVLVGMRKTLVFYQGRAPKGKKTDWVMHEFRMETTPAAGDSPKLPFKEDWVLCRVFFKNRSISTKLESMDTMTYDETNSSTLPPLMETFINYDHHHPPQSLEGYHEQVPCFSSNPSIMLPFASSSQGQSIITSAIGRSTVPNNQSSSSHISNNFLNPLSCDRKTVKAVLNHFNKLDQCNTNTNNSQKDEENPNRLGTYLTEGTTSLPSMWNPFGS